MKPISDIRKDYDWHSLDESTAFPNAMDQFTLWWNEAVAQNLDEVNAMTLCTVTDAGRPEGRIVLLKGFDEKGFVFFTNYESAKGKELANNPCASLVFFWKEMERQVRISGTVIKISSKASDEYFYSRPIGSQIGAWASNQSEVIANRAALEEKLAKLEISFQNVKPSRPAYWGGYCVIPDYFEFWQGRPNRLHDRLRYRLSGNLWIRERLSP